MATWKLSLIDHHLFKPCINQYIFVCTKINGNWICFFVFAIHDTVTIKQKNISCVSSANQYLPIYSAALQIIRTIIAYKCASFLSKEVCKNVFNASYKCFVYQIMANPGLHPVN